MEFFMKLGLVWQLIGVFALGLIGLVILGNLFVCLMSWRNGHSFFYWRD